MEVLENIVNAISFIITIVVDTIKLIIDLPKMIVEFFNALISIIPPSFSPILLFLIGFGLVIFIYRLVR